MESENSMSTVTLASGYRTLTIIREHGRKPQIKSIRVFAWEIGTFWKNGSRGINRLKKLGLIPAKPTTTEEFSKVIRRSRGKGK